MADREAAKKRVLETVAKGPKGFWWNVLVQEVCADLGIDLGEHKVTAPALARKVLLGLYPNRESDFQEIQWNDAQAELVLKTVELYVGFAIANMPKDPPKAEKAEPSGDKPAKKKRPAPPAPPKAPAPPAAPPAAPSA